MFVYRHNPAPAPTSPHVISENHEWLQRVQQMFLQMGIFFRKFKKKLSPNDFNSFNQSYNFNRHNELSFVWLP